MFKVVTVNVAVAAPVPQTAWDVGGVVIVGHCANTPKLEPTNNKNPKNNRAERIKKDRLLFTLVDKAVVIF